MRLLIDHIGIVARSLDKSVPFYEAMFGAPPVERVTWRGKDAEYVADMLAHPGLELDAAFFQIPYSHSILELIEYRGVREEGHEMPPMQVGAMHLGFYVENLDVTVERLKDLGVKFRSNAVDVPYGPSKGGRSIYFSDPNGVNLQLMQVTARPGGLSFPPDLKGSSS